MTDSRDIVEEARELLDAIDKSSRVGYAFKLLRLLADECERLREHVKDLNHDHEATIKHCEEYHE